MRKNNEGIRFSDNTTLFMAIPPGHHILDYLEDTDNDDLFSLAKKLKMHPSKLRRLICGDVRLTKPTIKLLSEATGTSEAYWNNLNEIYKKDLAKIKDYESKPNE